MTSGEPTRNIHDKREGNSVIPLSMIIYVFTLIPLAENLLAADPGLITPFYAEDA